MPSSSSATAYGLPGTSSACPGVGVAHLVEHLEATSGSRRSAATAGSSVRHIEQPSDEKTASAKRVEGPGWKRSAIGGAACRAPAPRARSRARTAPAARAAACRPRAPARARRRSSTAHATSATTRPIASQPSLAISVAGRNGSATRHAPSARSRTTASGETRERDPKQAHGWPRRPEASARPSSAAKPSMVAAATQAAGGQPSASPAASAISSATTAASSAPCTPRSRTPKVASAAMLARGRASFAAAAAASTTASALKAAPSTVTAETTGEYTESGPGDAGCYTWTPAEPEGCGGRPNAVDLVVTRQFLARSAGSGAGCVSACSRTGNRKQDRPEEAYLCRQTTGR